MLRPTLRVIHCSPSAIRFEEYIVRDTSCNRADRCSNEAPKDPNAKVAKLSAIITAQTRIDPVMHLTRLTTPNGVSNYFIGSLRFSCTRKIGGTGGNQPDTN
jgi:hypothetical protein